MKQVGSEEGWVGQTLVVQHDDWLIFPGDLAFTIQCKHGEQVGLLTDCISNRLSSIFGNKVGKMSNFT